MPPSFDTGSLDEQSLTRQWG